MSHLGRVQVHRHPVVLPGLPRPPDLGTASVVVLATVVAVGRVDGVGTPSGPSTVRVKAQALPAPPARPPLRRVTDARPRPG